MLKTLVVEEVVTFNIKASDDDEFMELAKAVPTKQSYSNNSMIMFEPLFGIADVAADNTTAKEKTKKKDTLSNLCQYSKAGSGYYPTSATVEALPPGVYKFVMTSNGLFIDSHQIVTDDLLRLPDSKSDEVISEIEKFWTLKSVFNKFGFSHKRGFLLWGPPGSGKTSTIAFVIKQMVAGGGCVFLGDCQPSYLAMGLKNFRDVEPDRPAVVVLEDIDTLIRTYGESQVLSVLDGEGSISNVCFLATTNYPENLDGRVVNRPSRFDRVVKIGMPNFEARVSYLKSRNLGLSDRTIEQWAEITDGFSIAHLKEVIVGVMCYGNDLEEQVKRLKAMAKTPKSSDMDKRMGF